MAPIKQLTIFRQGICFSVFDSVYPESPRGFFTNKSEEEPRHILSLFFIDTQAFLHLYATKASEDLKASQNSFFCFLPSPNHPGGDQFIF
jgi:hypothetical protein